MPDNKRNRRPSPEGILTTRSSLPSPAKHLGQHFLTDAHIAGRIVDAFDPRLRASLPVLEIGPGRMILTKILAERSSRLVLLEKDERLIPVLSETFARTSRTHPVEILCADALTAPFDQWTFPYLVVSNLPYNISVPLLMKIIGGPNPPRQAVLMFQKEVGERITASYGGREYGSLSVAVSLLSNATPLFNIRPGSFHPPPKIHSMVLSFVPRGDRDDPAFPGAIHLARSAFGYRRKTLKNAFSLGLSPPLSEMALRVIAAEPGLPESRPEQLPPERWVTLARRMIEHSPSIFDNIQE
jgi:16S rRNA (adenine1518-N6/adenine1519-N6)-dimethyltransferase